MLVAERRTSLSSRQAAKRCGLSRHSVTGLAERRVIRGSKSPVTGRWQIDLESLRTYLTRRGHRLPGSDGELVGLVVVGATGDFFRDLVEHLPAGVEVFLAPGHYDAGLIVGQSQPEIAVIDFRAGRSDAVDLGMRLTKARIRCVGLALEDETDARGLVRAGFAQILKRPVTAAAVRDAVTSIME